MATFNCTGASPHFFHSAAYLDPGFSNNWQTKSIPDADVGTAPIYQMVLDSCKIPITGPRPSGGYLPGIDILRMDALQAITFSLAESFLTGQWWEMYEDETGGVYFQDVIGGGDSGGSANLDVRFCIAGAEKSNIVNLVVVRGYDAPPLRYAGQTKTVVPKGSGPVNPTDVSPGLFTVDLKELVGGCIEGANLGTQVTKSYADPIITKVWGEQAKNPFYDLDAWETLVTHAITVQGMPDAGTGVTYQFNDDKTTWYYPVTTMPSFSRTEATDIHTDCSYFQTGTGITFYKGTLHYTGKYFEDRYGYQWPFITQPTATVAVAYPIMSLSGGAPGGGWNVVMGAIPKLINIPWFYTPTGVNKLDITMYYQPKCHPDVWDLVSSVMSGAEGLVTTYAWAPDFQIGTIAPPFNQATIGAIGGDGYGFAIAGLWVAMTVAQPSVTVTDVNGDARTHSDELQIDNTPIVVKDLPVPIGYYGAAGSAALGPEELAQGKLDNDPTTCQELQNTPEAIMQDLMQGNVIDVSFPFCATAEECLACARTIYEYQQFEGVQTYVLTCGPSSSPKLGQAVAGYGDLRVETINYSYQDGGSYSVEVTLGPKFVNVGSWNANGPWIRQTATVSRPAIVLSTAGNGSDYRVYVQGMGDYNAINGTRYVWRPGETVQVSVYNVPQEV